MRGTKVVIFSKIKGCKVSGSHKTNPDPWQETAVCRVHKVLNASGDQLSISLCVRELGGRRRNEKDSCFLAGPAHKPHQPIKSLLQQDPPETCLVLPLKTTENRTIGPMLQRCRDNEERCQTVLLKQSHGRFFSFVSVINIHSSPAEHNWTQILQEHVQRIYLKPVK